MATCLGHRYGTGCMYRSRNTQKRDNWEKWQLCYKCARILHPEFYEKKHNHGVNIPIKQRHEQPDQFGIIKVISQ